MSRIGGKNTRPEVALRKALWALGLRYRLHQKIAGKPDVVFPGARVAVFVDGCFWHGCPIHGSKPKTNSEFWNRKLASNAARDQRVAGILEMDGWKVVRVWEHEVDREVTKVAARIMCLVKRYMSRADRSASVPFGATRALKNHMEATS
jgi:DNA mismatch endonuclease (patch repair protein)